MFVLISGSGSHWIVLVATKELGRVRQKAGDQQAAPASPMKSEPPTPTRAPDNQFRKV